MSAWEDHSKTYNVYQTFIWYYFTVVDKCELSELHCPVAGLVMLPSSFEEVGRAYCFGLFRLSVHHAFHVSIISKEPLELGS